MSFTKSVTMENVKSEDGSHSIWQGYSVQAPSNTVQPQSFEPGYQPHPISVSFNDRSQKVTYRSLDIPLLNTRPPPRGGTSAVLTASPPSFNFDHSFPSMKRAFNGTEDLNFAGKLPEFKEEMSEAPRPAINQDHRLLYFAKLPDKHTILDSQGRVKSIELIAQIHGMFFLSELATTPGEALITQPELTCYRRNLFQISGNVKIPRGTLSLLTERGDRLPIISTEVVISATESVDGHIVKLIVIPWKTPPPNSAEIPTGQEHEPAPIPLVPSDESPDSTSDFSVHPIAYRRLQFRIATANNGRRRELQQHFTLHLNLIATLANGVKLNVCETSTAPIVVRGRSPRNFQARKEIPLVGSSSSRGQLPELHIATNISPRAGPVSTKPREVVKPQQLELPRSPFTFDSNSIAGSPSMIHQVAYPAWNDAHTPDHGTAPNTPSYPVSSVGLESYLQVNNSNADLSHVVPSQPTTMGPIRQQYTYSTGTATIGESLRFIDNNPRPTKSPRHIAPPAVPSNVYPDYGTRFVPSYTGTTEVTPSRAPEYFPPGLPLQSWTSAPNSTPLYGTSNGVPGLQHYEFPGQQFVKEENSLQQQQNQQLHYTWQT